MSFDKEVQEQMARVDQLVEKPKRKRKVVKGVPVATVRKGKYINYGGKPSQLMYLISLSGNVVSRFRQRIKGVGSTLYLLSLAELAIDDINGLSKYQYPSPLMRELTEWDSL